MNFQIPPATQALIVANIAVYLVQMFSGNALLGLFALWPIGTPFTPDFMPWQLVTYGFLHGGPWHLLINMFVLFSFGGEIERLFGPRWFLLYYFVCVVSAALLQLVVALFTDAAYYVVGASGGIMGLLLAYGMYFPRRTIVLLIPPIPMPAAAAVFIFGALSLLLGVSGAMPGVAHFAHLGGMVGGFLMILHRRGWKL